MPTHVSLTTYLDTMSDSELMEYSNNLKSKRVILEKQLEKTNLSFIGLDNYTRTVVSKYTTKLSDMTPDNIIKYIKKSISEIDNVLKLIVSYY